MEPVRERTKKAGRPAKAVKKEVRACIRFTRPEYFIVKEKAAISGMKASAYIRQLAIYSNVTSRLTEEDRESVRQLIGIANNVNQLAKLCHQEGVLRGMVYFETFRPIVDVIIKKFNP
jgi:hypothetical protein